MSYISQEEKKEIAPVVKSILKKYGLKGSLSIHNYSDLVLNIKEGELHFIGNYIETMNNRGYNELSKENQEYLEKEQYMDVNLYWYQDHFTGKVKEFFDEIVPALKGKGWYDNSDIQADYFDIKHYFSVNIGRWNKPYSLKT